MIGEHPDESGPRKTVAFRGRLSGALDQSHPST